MGIALLFWILALLAIVFLLIPIVYRGDPKAPYQPNPIFSNLFLFVLIILLGWRTFGAALKE